jgi:hypothetical protein
MVLICVVLTVPSMAQAQSDTSHDEDFRTYEKTQELAKVMFSEFLHENFVKVRVSALLTYCEKEGLANAVNDKLVDRKLKDKLIDLIHQGKFDDLPRYATLEAQATANAMIAGYSAGILDGLGLGVDNSKSSTCAAAVDEANKILRK